MGTIAQRFKQAVRYFRAISREPVSRHEQKARQRAVNESLRRYVVERQLTRAVAEAILPNGADRA